MSKYNFLFSILKGAGLMKGAASRQDIPELTNFLKNNQAFKDACWKVYDIKKTLIRKLDEEVGHVEPGNQNNKKIHGKKK